MRTATHLLFVSHDANRAGAQLFLLNIMNYFHEQGHSLHLLLLGSGPLESDFESVSNVIRVKSPATNGGWFTKLRNETLEKQLQILKKLPIQLVYVNTIACASVVEPIKRLLGVPLVSHLHELEFSLQLYAEPYHRKAMMTLSDHLIACSIAVGENIREKDQISANKLTTIHSFVDNARILKRIEATNRQAIKEKFGLPAHKFLIASCGNAEWRKGLDIFIQVANQLKNIRSENDFHFVWIGIKHEGDLYEKAMYDIEKMGLQTTVSLIEPTDQAVELITTSDVFLVSSREDPFPLVMLEAALAKKPILGFDKTGGCGEFVETDAGFVAPYLDTNAVAHQLSNWIDNAPVLALFGEKAFEKVTTRYNFETSIKKIENLCLSFLQDKK